MDKNRLEKQAIGIVSQLFDLAEVPVEKRQQINDTAYDYMLEQLRLHNVVGQSEQLPDAYKTELSNVKQLGQTQTSLEEQLQILRTFANKLGLYDAADYLQK